MLFILICLLFSFYSSMEQIKEFRMNQMSYLLLYAIVSSLRAVANHYEENSNKE